MTHSDNIARIIARHDQALASAVDWWNSHDQNDRINLLRLLCDPKVEIKVYREVLNDQALMILRDLAALALGQIIISGEVEL